MQLTNQDLEKIKNLAKQWGKISARKPSVKQVQGWMFHFLTWKKSGRQQKQSIAGSIKQNGKYFWVIGRLIIGRFINFGFPILCLSSPFFEIENRVHVVEYVHQAAKAIFQNGGGSLGSVCELVNDLLVRRN